MITGRRTRPLGAARRAQRAVGFLWFCVVTIPVLFFGAGLAVDFTRVIVAQREASNLAAASATAGSYAFEPGKPWLDRSDATRAAQDMWKWGTAQAPTSMARSEYNAAPMVKLDGGAKAPQVTFSGFTGGRTSQPTEITVTARYTVRDLLFLGYFTGKNTSSQVASSTAFVCIPNDEDRGYTAGYCVRPEIRA